MLRIRQKRWSYGDLLLIALLLGTGTSALLAQSLGGTLRGRVRDASGGVIAATEVTARDTEKGILYQTRTDDMGVYQIALPVAR